MPGEADVPQVLLGLARDDELAAKSLLSVQGVTDAILGFHAQQAVEKSLKAVLAFGRSSSRSRTISTDCLSFLADDMRERWRSAYGLCLVGSECGGDIVPLFVGWPLLQLTLDGGDDRGELAVVERPDEDDAGV